jgi:hypothetical protein
VEGGRQGIADDDETAGGKAVVIDSTKGPGRSQSRRTERRPVE